MIELVVFDVDGTLTSHGSVWRYIHERLGLWEGNADRYQAAYLAGEISYEEFCRRDAVLWRGLEESDLLDLAGRIDYNPGVPRALARLRESGLRLAAVSTGLSLLVDRIAAELEIEFALSNSLVVSDGLITGEVELRVSDGRKGRAIRQIEALSGIALESMAAVGDSETDLDMFQAVRLSVAYGGTSARTREAADFRVAGGDFGAVADVILRNLNHAG